jgi:hypothetical protein
MAMQALEINANIDQQGNIHLPEQYCAFYDQQVKIIILMNDDNTAQSIAQLSEPALSEVWNNADDAVYNQVSI